MFQALLVKLRKHLFNASIRRKLMYAMFLTVSIPLIISGILSLQFFYDLAYKNTANSVLDKVHIASLLVENKKTSLLTACKSLAEDNLILINMDLLLFQPITSYLEEIKDKNELAFAFILDSGGQVIASANQAMPAPGQRYFNQASLNRISESGGSSFATRIGSEEFFTNENLNPIDGERELSLIAVHPLATQDGKFLGYACIGLMFGSQEGGDYRGADNFMDATRRQLQIPFAITSLSHVIKYSDGAADFKTFPEELYKSLKRTPDKTIWTLPIGKEKYLWSFLQLTDDSTVTVGSLGIAYPLAEYLKMRMTVTLIIAGVLILAFAIAISVALYLAKILAAPIIAVAEGAKRIIKGDFDFKMPATGNDEIGVMAEEFSVMTLQLKTLVGELGKEVAEHKDAENKVRQLNEDLEHTVKSRTSELTKSNEALAESLEFLKSTQKQLVEAEKIAALGTLVAGMAHEINTPIGNGLTASSFLENKVKEFSDHFQKSALDQPDLREFLEISGKLAESIKKSMLRAAEQIRFFKQVAVNQEEESLSMVSLREYVDELSASLGPQFMKPGYSIINRVSGSAIINVFPAALYQVLVNLLQNCILHGFAGRDSGVISIETFEENESSETVTLSIYDNGAGMAVETIRRIFDPFFTTKRGEGRAGLGLSIVYNIVTGKLRGSIECSSAPDEGTTMKIVIPRSL